MCWTSNWGKRISRATDRRDPMTKTERNTTVHESVAATYPLRTQLAGMHMSYVLQHYEDVATAAAAQHWSHFDYLAHLIEGAAQRREDRSLARRLSLARFTHL